MKNKYKIDNVYVISTMMNINIDINIDGKDYNYNAEWDYKERYATITGEEGYDILGDEFDKVRDAIHDYLNTQDVNNPNKTKLSELMDEINLEC